MPVPMLSASRPWQSRITRCALFAFIGPPANASYRSEAFAEGGVEGPRRIIFDMENISQHEKTAGARSEGLTIGPCCDYNESQPTLLCDLEIVYLVLMRLRTSEVRELQAVVSHQGLVIMGGNAAVATAMANHWKAEREAKPCNVLLQFLGAAVEHEAAQASGVDTVDNALSINDNAQESIVRALVPALERALDQAVSVRFEEAAVAQAQWQQATLRQLDATLREMGCSLSRPVVNINTSARHEGDLDKVNVEAPENAEAAARLRSAASPLTKFLREQWQPEWVLAGVRHTSCTLQFSILMQARALSALCRRALPSRVRQAAKMKELQAQGQPGRYVGQIGRAQAFYTTADKPLMHRVFEEDIWPVDTAAAIVGGALVCRVASGRSGGHRC